MGDRKPNQNKDAQHAQPVQLDKEQQGGKQGQQGGQQQGGKQGQQGGQQHQGGQQMPGREQQQGGKQPQPAQNREVERLSSLRAAGHARRYPYRHASPAARSFRRGRRRPGACRTLLHH